MPNNHDIFISYKAEELTEALWVRSVLEENGFSCWMAPTSIPGGSSYADEIDTAITECEVFVLILSERAQQSKWVKKELDMALNKEKVILPFMIENCQLQKAFNYYLTDVQRYNAYISKMNAMNEMIKRIKAVAGKGSLNERNDNEQQDGDSADVENAIIYNEALSMMKNIPGYADPASSVDILSRAVARFETIPQYKDSSARITECKNMSEMMRQRMAPPNPSPAAAPAKKKSKAPLIIAIILILGVVGTLTLVGIFAFIGILVGDDSSSDYDNGYNNGYDNDQTVNFDDYIQSAPNPEYTALFAGTGITHEPDLSSASVRCFASYDDFYNLYCIDYGYSGDKVTEWVETFYCPISGLTQEEISSTEETYDLFCSAYEALDCCTYSKTVDPSNKYLVVTLKFTNLYSTKNMNELIEIGLLESGVAYISMNASAQNRINEDFVEK